MVSAKRTPDSRLRDLGIHLPAAPTPFGTYVEAVERLRNDIGIPRRLRDLGVTESQLRPFAEKAASIKRILRVNPLPVSADDLEAIYRSAF